jgi:hypothetical protein
MEGLIAPVIGMTTQMFAISGEEPRWLVGGFLLGRPGSSLRLVLLAYVRVQVTDLLPFLWECVGQDSSDSWTAGDRVPVVARFSALVQTGPVAHPASCTMGTGSFPGVKRPGHDVDHPPHLAPRLKKEYSYTCTPLLGFRGLF